MAYILALLTLLSDRENIKHLIALARVLPMLTLRYWLYCIVAVGTAGLYVLGVLLAWVGLTLVWNLRFGVLGFTDSFLNALLSFFIFMAVVVVGVLFLMWVEYLVPRLQASSSVS